MSRIYFHSPHGEAEVRGSERAHMGILCSDLAAAVLRQPASYWGTEPPSILRVIASDSYLHKVEPERFTQTFNTWLSVGMGGGFVIDDQLVESFSVYLNTALRIGSDPIKLMARLHGQCEIHCYVEGPHRPWLADIIEHGRDVRIMRRDEGWEDVVDLLRTRVDEPVVCSYSVCEKFPNSYVADWTPPAHYDGEPSDAWYDLPDNEHWRLGMAGLRSKHGGLELKPDNWSGFYFDSGTDAFQILDHLSAARSPLGNAKDG